MTETKLMAESYSKIISHFYPVFHEGIVETPMRAAKAMEEMMSGMDQDPLDVMKLFKEDSKNNQVVVVRDIPFYSLCEHHMLPFFGKVNILYEPDQYVMGLSKFPRVVDILSRRMQVQERLTKQIGEAICEGLSLKHVLVQVVARHMCMEMRGVRKSDTHTISTFASGKYKDTSTEFSNGIHLLNINIR